MKQKVIVDGKIMDVEIHERDCIVNKKRYYLSHTAPPIGVPFSITVNEKRYSIFIERGKVYVNGYPHDVEIGEVDMLRESSNIITAPMSGRIVSVYVREGERVNKGDIVLVLESMKMENEFYSPKNGIVRKIVGSGEKVKTGDIIFSME